MAIEVWEDAPFSFDQAVIVGRVAMSWGTGGSRSGGSSPKTEEYYALDKPDRHIHTAGLAFSPHPALGLALVAAKEDGEPRNLTFQVTDNDGETLLTAWVVVSIRSSGEDVPSRFTMRLCPAVLHDDDWPVWYAKAQRDLALMTFTKGRPGVDELLPLKEWDSSQWIPMGNAEMPPEAIVGAAVLLAYGGDSGLLTPRPE